MLKNTFCHISGIGLKTERQLWASGILDWEGFFQEYRLRAAIPRKETIHRTLESSLDHLKNNNPVYFQESMPSHLHWRLFPEFREKAAYVDIETTGLDFFNDITTIALYDGKLIRHYVNGRNLDAFVDDISDYNVIISYNGKCFDVPFLERYFRIKMKQAHIDRKYSINPVLRK